jgi:hypothetical protein
LPLDTDLSAAPFFNDYDETKNFHQVLFRPSIPVQAREVNQLQTILQNQIERFGDNIYQTGTIIKGCSFFYDNNYNYIKLLDNRVDGRPVNTSSFANTLLISSSNLQAIVVNNVDGLQSQNPDLNTLYVKYQNSGSDGKKQFIPGEILAAYNQTRTLQGVVATVPGTNYSNTDLLVFTGGGGTGAAGHVLTNSSGALVGGVLTANGINYTSVPAVTITNSIGGASSGSGGTLTAQINIAQLTVANTSFQPGSNTDSNTVGSGYAFSVSDGIIFQKGYFVRVDPQTSIISKYDTSPTNVVVGFKTNEIIITENTDTSLLDNAAGSTNYTAPGAYRLKLEPVLSTTAANTAVNTNEFFSLAEWNNGSVIKTFQSTQFNAIETEIAKRTSEEAGDFLVSPFNIILNDISSNTTHLQARIGSGVAYVDGYRVEQITSFPVPIRKGTDTAAKTNVDISMSIGNFVIVTNMLGTIPFNNAVKVQLQDTVNSGIAAAAGTQIGSASVRALVYNSGSGTPQYRLYLFNVQMNSGKNFTNVRSVYYNGSLKGTADIVLDTSNNAVIMDPSFNTLVFPSGSRAVKTLRDGSGTNSTQYIYSTVDTGTSFAANGTLQKTLVGDVFPYSGTLDSVSEGDFIFIAQANVSASANLPGNVSYDASTNTVAGIGTTFLTDFNTGDNFATGTGEVRQVVSIANNISLTVNSHFNVANTTTNYKRYYLNGQPITFNNKVSRTINVSGSTMTAQLGETLASPLSVTSVYNVQHSTAIALTKNITKNAVIRITTAVGGNTGPWCLGMPDVRTLISVTKTTNSDYVTSAVDVTSEFTIDNGQKDSFYNLAYLVKKPTSSLVIGATDYITVLVDAFTYTNTGGGLGFFSIDSYPIDDATVPVPIAKIRTQDIPLFISPTTGNVLDLRDSIDFRPVVSNTANVTSNTALVTINPANTVSFASSEKYFPATDKTFVTALQNYLGRYDKISVDSQGNFNVSEGVVSSTPVPPTDITNTLTLATVTVPPYPTLSYASGSLSKRPDYTAIASVNTTTRLTQPSLNKLNTRVTQLEYYAALSLLETKTKDLVIPSAITPTQNAFKNGIFVEPFIDFTLSNLTNGEFTASIDVSKQELQPKFKQSKFNLQVLSTNNVIVKDDIAYLAPVDVPVITQPYSATSRNCSGQPWNYTGKISLFPEYFNYYDIRYDPNTGWAGPGMISSFNNDVYISGPNSNTVISLTQTSGAVNIYTNQSFINQIKLMVPAPSTDNTFAVFSGSPYQFGSPATTIGDYLKLSTASQTFVYEHTILVKAVGLKPNTVFAAFFDGVDVSQWTVSITEDTYNRDVLDKTSYVGAGFGNPAHPPLTSNSAGRLWGAFYMPRGYFFTGSKLFEIKDNKYNPTTSASCVYTSFDNISIDSNPDITSTRPVVAPGDGPLNPYITAGANGSSFTYVAATPVTPVAIANTAGANSVTPLTIPIVATPIVDITSVPPTTVLGFSLTGYGSSISINTDLLYNYIQQS